MFQGTEEKEQLACFSLNRTILTDGSYSLNVETERNFEAANLELLVIVAQKAERDEGAGRG